MTKHVISYRPDIDGLRALAVLPVVLFHAGIPGFSGGFAGVDVFFVISGYLITTLLLKDLNQGSFSILDFYVRRIRRILPALLIVVLVSLIAGFFFLTPQQYAATGAAARAVMTISANMHFANIRSDYWNQSALAEQPLLHAWSLAVEEQFYLILPGLLCLVHAFSLKFSSSRVVKIKYVYLVLLATLCLLSFVFAEWLLRSRPGDAFFLLAPRAGELLIGSLLAVVQVFRPVYSNQRLLMCDIAGFSGMLLLITSYTVLKEAMVFPGFSALLPCVGAALIIYSGSNTKGIVSRLLSWRPLVVVGLISYSLYLWHWPVLVFFRSAGWHGRMLFDVPIPMQLLIMTFLAWLSWRWIEQPFRRGTRRAATVMLVAGGSSLFIWLSGAQVMSIAQGKGLLAQQLPSAVIELDSLLKVTPGARCEGSGDPSRILTDGGGCVVGAIGDEYAFALLGDSHARMYTEAVHKLGQEYGTPIIVMARSSCVPAQGLVPPTRKECEELTRASVNYLLNAQVDNVVLAGYWVDIAATETEAAKLSTALSATVEALTNSGKRVFLMKDVPQLTDDAYPRQAAMRSIREQGATVYGPSFIQHAETQWKVASILDTIAEKWGAIILDPADFLCDTQGCKVALGNRPLYRDRHHLTDAAALGLRSLFVPALEKYP